MDGQWVPEGIMALSPTYRNFFENTATVQFDHRMLAYATATSVAALTSVALYLKKQRP
jgi:cytochrome c oxidase assembly protein subunit 15